MPVFYYCKQHNYFGSNNDGICPKCFPINTANQDAKKSHDDLEPPRMLYTILMAVALWAFIITMIVLVKKGII
jgi:hypothetical protein